MTVTATSYTPITYNGNGSTSVFNITFQFYEVAVIHIDSAGSETEWTENTHYTVTGGEGSTGSITATPTVPATGEKLRIERRTSKDQPRDYDLDNAVLEAALQQSDDRLAMILQELDYDNRRRPAISKANYTAEVEFPTASTGSVLSWGSGGNLVNTALIDLDGVAISALTAATELEDTDLFPIYDNGAGDNASITWASVKAQISAYLDLGTFAGLDELPNNSVTSGKVANGSITSDKLADNIQISGSFGFGDDAPEFRYKTGGSTDLNWKNICDVTIGDSLPYKNASFEVIVQNANTSNGATATITNMYYTVACRRSNTVLNAYNDALVEGPKNEYVRVVKTSTGVYEIQVRQNVNYRHVTFRVRNMSHNGDVTITYNQTPSDGSTSGAIYTVTEPDPYHGSSLNTLQKVTAAVNFNGTGTVSIRDSFNIQSITDLGTGSYRLNFANAMSNTDYVVVATARDGNNVMVTALNYTVNSVDIKTVNGPGAGSGIAFYNYDCDPINVVVFGGTS